ncbi:MAG: hypothetical protein M1379_02970 [Firmicutes bacterium]|nr:hypothetical protein [Bacillota bacterium]
MRINRYVMPVTVIAILALSVATASVMGLWKTSGRQDILEKVDRGAAKAEDIKGWMTLKEIGDAFRISVPELISRLGLPAKVDINAPLKDYLEEYGLSITAIRDEVRAMLEK